VRDILAGDNPALFALDVDAQIRTAYQDLVAGDAFPFPASPEPAGP
jgi:hypothetical protein